MNTGARITGDQIAQHSNEAGKCSWHGIGGDQSRGKPDTAGHTCSLVKSQTNSLV